MGAGQVFVLASKLQALWAIAIGGLLAVGQLLNAPLSLPWLIIGIGVVAIIFVGLLPVSFAAGFALDRVADRSWVASVAISIVFTGAWAILGARVFGGQQPAVGAAISAAGALVYCGAFLFARRRINRRSDLSGSGTQVPS